MNEQSMLPKSFEYEIGEKKFKFSELTCLRRDALLKIISSFTFAEIMKSIMPLLDELNINLNQEGKVEEDAQIGTLVQLALQNESIWGGMLLCILDFLKIGPDVICLSLCEKDTLEENELYIKNNLTIRQEPIILEKIIEINDLPQTLKNYKSLLAKVKKLAQMNKMNS